MEQHKTASRKTNTDRLERKEPVAFWRAAGRKAVPLFALAATLMLAASSVFAQVPNPVSPERAGLRFPHSEQKAPESLAQKPGGPTERIEVQTTNDHIDYVVKTYTLKCANASEVYELIKAAVTIEGGKVDRISAGSLCDVDMEKYEVKKSYSGDSMLVVTAPDWMMPYLDATIAQLDRPGLESGSFGTASIFAPIHHRLPSEVAELINASTASPSIVLKPDDTRQLLYMEDAPSFFAYDLAALKEFDAPPPQIETRVRIYEINDSRSKDVGIDWYAWKKSIKDGDLTFKWEGKPGSYDIDLQSLSAELSFSPQLATEFLNYLVSKNHAKVITDSRLTQINSKPAVVKSVLQVPYVLRGFIDGTVADSPLRDSPEALDADGLIKEFKQGVVVEMNPRIAREIEIAVHAEVSSLVGYTPNQSVPLITESAIDTIVLLEPGKAAVLGGLKREGKVSGRSGIPGLKNIPYIKYLFSRSVESTQLSHIIITIELERIPAGASQKVETAEMLPKK